MSSGIRECAIQPQFEPDRFVGRILSDAFRVDAPLQAGALGMVYTGIQLSVDRPVAIKLWRPNPGTAEEMNEVLALRFAREARCTAHIEHPNTVRFLEWGVTEDGLRYATRDDRGSVMAVSGPAIDDLALNPRGLATRRLSRINRYRVESFSYRRGDDSLAVRREGDGWTTDDGKQFPDSMVYEFLSLLFETRVSGWREERSDAPPPVAVLRYRLDGGQEGSIEFLPGNEGRVSEASGIVYGLAGSAPGVPRHR